jgi:hypothetical protein
VGDPDEQPASSAIDSAVTQSGRITYPG